MAEWISTERLVWYMHTYGELGTPVWHILQPIDCPCEAPQLGEIGSCCPCDTRLLQPEPPSKSIDSTETTECVS